MTTSIEILTPSGSVFYTEGILLVTNINVHFYFANVVFIVINFSDKSQKKYYQVPCILTLTP
jgi:hypothetical protein